jgi:hypothetical protein
MFMTFTTFMLRLISATGDAAVFLSANLAVLGGLRGDAFDFVIKGHLVDAYAVGTVQPQDIVSRVHAAPVREAE